MPLDELFINESITESIVSLAIVVASTTVGIPTAITLTPKFSSFICFLLFPTPAPGDIPVSPIWIVVFTLSTFLAAKASIHITKSGLIFSTTPLIISTVSIPVTPSTPGATEQTGLTDSSIASGITVCKCLVTIIFSVTFGPNASGVTCQFPSPTTNTVLSVSILINLCKISDTTCETLSIVSPSYAVKSGIPIVI